MANPLTSPLSGIVEPVVTQEQKGSFMQCPIQSAQIGQQITQIIQTSPEPQALLASIAKTLGEIFQGDTCLIVALGFAQQGAPAAQPADRLIANPGVTTQLALWCADDDQTTLPPGYQAQLLEHPVLKDGLTGTQPLAIPDLQASDSWEGRSWHGEVLHARAILRIHTRFQTAVNGMIILGRSQPYEWTTQEKELLSSVSESVAIAISQVQLISRYRRRLDAKPSSTS
jgi:GAF domain-containing protein